MSGSGSTYYSENIPTLTPKWKTAPGFPLGR